MSRPLKSEYLLSGLFFLGVFLYLLRPVGAEQDFWWHLASGRWIWEHRGLPNIDPFSLFPSPTPDSHDLLTLKGFWLSQILYYRLHEAGGLAAICLSGALCMTTIIYLAWLILRQHLPHPFTCVALIPLVAALGYFSEYRPQQFTFLFFALLLYLLERIIANLERNGRMGLPAFCIPLLLLLWAQMHPGYAVAFPLIAIYAITLCSSRWGQAGGSSILLKVLLLILACIIATMAAPNGPSALRDIVAETWGLLQSSRNGTIASFTVDYSAPWNVAPVFGPWYWRLLLASLSAALIAILVCNREIPRRFTAMTVLYAALALAAYRYGIFFFITGAVVTGWLINRFVIRIPFSIKSVAGTMTTVCLSLGLLVTGMRTGVIANGTFTPSLISDQAVRFLLESGIHGGVANPYSWGGYLIWRTWPKYRIFRDQRLLGGQKGYDRYNQVMFMEETAVLDRMRINAVIINPADPVTASVYYGFITLMESGGWDLVYYDDIAALFCRSSQVTHLPRLNKGDLVQNVIASLLQWEAKSPSDPTSRLLLGQIRLWQENFAEARRCFTTAAALDSHDERPRKWLEALTLAESSKKGPNQ